MKGKKKKANVPVFAENQTYKKPKSKKKLLGSNKKKFF